MGKLFGAWFGVRRAEVPQVLGMASLFFLVIAGFWILKPIKKALFINHYGARGGLWLGGAHLGPAEVELLAKGLNVGVALLATLAFARLSRRLRRQRLMQCFAALSLVSLAAFALPLERPGTATVWGFYLFGDLFNMVLVASFFAFQNDSVSPSVARRIYGPVGLGGVLGGVFGASVVRARVSAFDAGTWVWVVCALTLAVCLLAEWVARKGVGGAAPPGDGPGVAEFDARAGLSGARVVAASPYLLSIVGLVALYEVVSTVMEFQFSATIVHYLSDPSDVREQFANVYLATNALSLVTQLVLTGLVMRKLGVASALSVLPVAVLVVSGGFVLLPVLWLGSSLSVTHNALHYSVHQSAKESLYVPTSAVEKYRAKAFIDVFVQRAAKAVGVLLSLGMQLVFRDFAAVRWLSVVVVAVSFLWLLLARRAGRGFEAAATRSLEAPAE